MESQKLQVSAAMECDLALDNYFQGMDVAFRRSCQGQPSRHHRVVVAGLTISVQLSSAQMAAALLPALAHLETDVEDAPTNITLCLWEGAACDVRPPRPPFTLDDYRRYGQRAIAHDGTRSLMHAPTVDQLFAYDRTTRRGYFWVKDASQFSIYERAAPVQTIFHWALHNFGWQIVHAAAVGNADGGVLLVGGTGAGKSTTALSCLTQEGLHFLSDDKCLVRLAPEPQTFALFNSAKIKGDMLARLPHLRPLLSGWDNSYKANKGLVFLHPTYADRMIHAFPVKALLLPQVAHRDVADIRPVPASSVFRQLGPSTVIWLPGAEAETYRFTAAMTRRLPCYRIALARDPQVNGDAMRRLLEEL